MVVRAAHRWARFKTIGRCLQDAAAVRSLSPHALIVLDRLSGGRCLLAIGGRVGDGHIGWRVLAASIGVVDGDGVT